MSNEHVCQRWARSRIRSESGVRLHLSDSDPDLKFWEKPDPDLVCMIWCIQHVCKSMAEIGTEPDPDSESKIWRLIGFGAGTGFLVFGSGSGVNFSNSRPSLMSVYSYLCFIDNSMSSFYYYVVLLKSFIEKTTCLAIALLGQMKNPSVATSPRIY